MKKIVEARFYFKIFRKKKQKKLIWLGPDIEFLSRPKPSFYSVLDYFFEKKILVGGTGNFSL